MTLYFQKLVSITNHIFLSTLMEKKSALFVVFTHARVTFAEIVLLMNFMYLHSPHHTPKRVYKFIIRSITVYFLDTAFDAN